MLVLRVAAATATCLHILDHGSMGSSRRFPWSFPFCIAVLFGRFIVDLTCRGPRALESVDRRRDNELETQASTHSTIRPGLVRDMPKHAQALTPRARRLPTRLLQARLNRIRSSRMRPRCPRPRSLRLFTGPARCRPHRLFRTPRQRSARIL